MFKKSIGTRYLEKLGLEKANNFHEMRSLLEKKIGKEAAEAFISYINRRGEAESKGKQLNEKEFYEFKNQSYDSGLYASAAFDGEIFVKTCDWIAENKDAFGKTILDVGCDTGIVSCFLAEQLPESTILSIDDGTNAISVAKALSENLGIKNISFRNINVKEITEQYDTVFSSRTLHENLSNNVSLKYAPFKERCFIAKDATYDYLEVLTNCIKANGNLIGLERLSDEAARTGYKLALNELGLDVDNNKFTTLECKTIDGGLEYITSSIATKAENYEKKSAAYIIDDACKPIVKKATYNYQRYMDEVGEIVLHSDQGTFIKGFYIYFKNRIVGKYALYHSVKDLTTIYFVQCFDTDDAGEQLLRYDISKQEELKEFLDKEASNFTKRGLLIRKFEVDDDGNEIIIKNLAAERSAVARMKKNKKKSKKKKK